MHFAEHNEEERKQKGLFHELTVSQRQVSFETCKPVDCARVLGCCRVRAECRQLFRHHHVLAPSVLRSGGARILSCSEFRKPALHPGIRHFHCANELDVSHQVRVSALGKCTTFSERYHLNKFLVHSTPSAGVHWPCTHCTVALSCVRNRALDTSASSQIIFTASQVVSATNVSVTAKCPA